MKKLRLLRGVLRRTNADKLIIGFVIFFLIDALIVMIAEPDIKTYADAVWYCYSVFSTAGFGDFSAVTFVGRLMSVILTIYTIIIVAIVTGVIVAFYNDIVSMKYKASKAEILDKLEHLDELSKEELAEISDKIKKVM